MARERRLPAHRRPTHPGIMLEEEVRKPCNLTQQQLADALGISRGRYVEIAAGRRGITPNTALRIARVLGTSTTMWLNAQIAVDIWDAKTSTEYAAIEKLTPLLELVDGEYRREKALA